MFSRLFRRAVGSVGSDNALLHPRCGVESLERRVLMSVNVLVHHGDAANDGANLAETVLTPADVNSADFGKRFTTSLDGVVTPQPLYVQNVDITRGSSIGVHSVAYVVTQHDSLYAIDANTGAILWQDSFLNITTPTSLTATTGVTTMPASEVGDNAGPELGIWSTPAIDLSRGAMFLVTNTQEVRGSDLHFVQRLWSVNLSDGSPIVAPAVIGDTISNGPRLNFSGYTYVSGPIVNGTGNNAHPTTYPNTDGWASAPGGATTPVIAFNALVQGGRPGVTLMGDHVYLAFSAHVDQSPYYGWILGYSESTLALTAAFVTTPTYEGIVTNSSMYTAQGGIWSSGSALTTDGTSLYVTTSPGAFNVAASNFNAQGFPIDHDYADSLLKLQVDPSSTPQSQNGNGWGLKVVDYFTPSNAYQLGQNNLDLGSGGVTLLPNTITDAAGDPLMVLGTKESRLYVIDQDNLGKFNPAYPLTSNPDPRLYDHVVNEYAADGIDGTTEGMYDAPVYANGIVYIGQQYAGGLAFSASALASGKAVTPLQTTAAAYGYAGPTYTLSANGSTGGVLWGMNYAASDLLAYNAANITTPIYDSNTVSGDAYTGGTKFAVVTVANGMAYLATTADTFIGYGLRTAYLSSNATYFSAPTQLVASAVTATDVHLSWTSQSSLATEFRIDRSTDGSTWVPLTYVSNAVRSYDDTVTGGTKYYYRVTAISGGSSTSASGTASVTTPLSGAIIGTAGSYASKGNTIANAFDGNLTTFFDGPVASNDWVGLDLGSAEVITSIAYASRAGWESRMNGGMFQGSNSANFSTGVVTLFTIPAGADPSSTMLTTQSITNTGSFRYVRYLGGANSYGNISELQFFGMPPVLSGTLIGTSGSYASAGNTIAKAMDGNLATFFDGPVANGDWVGLDLGTAQSIDQISYAPRSGWAGRMVGGVFQVSTTADFSSGVTTIYTITTTPVVGSLTTITLSSPVSARYVRYLSPIGGYGNIAELVFYG